MVRMFNPLQNTIKMLVSLALACEQELAEAKLPGAHGFDSTVAQSASRACSQEWKGQPSCLMQLMQPRLCAEVLVYVKPRQMTRGILLAGTMLTSKQGCSTIEF